MELEERIIYASDDLMEVFVIVERHENGSGRCLVFSCPDEFSKGLFSANEIEKFAERMPNKTPTAKIFGLMAEKIVPNTSNESPEFKEFMANCIRLLAGTVEE